MTSPAVLRRAALVSSTKAAYLSALEACDTFAEKHPAFHPEYGEHQSREPLELQRQYALLSHRADHLREALRLATTRHDRGLATLSAVEILKSPTHPDWANETAQRCGTSPLTEHLYSLMAARMCSPTLYAFLRSRARAALPKDYNLS